MPPFRAIPWTSPSVKPSKRNSRKLISSSIDITELKEKEEELTIKSRSLEDLNTALRVMLKQREQDREELEKTLLSNVKEFVLPYIEKLNSEMDVWTTMI